MAIPEVTSANFDATVINASTPCAVFFNAIWSAPSKTMTPKIESLANAYIGRLPIYSMNADDCQDITSHFQIKTIPTLVVFKNGKIVDALVGGNQIGPIETLIKKYV